MGMQETIDQIMAQLASIGKEVDRVADAYDRQSRAIEEEHAAADARRHKALPRPGIVDRLLSWRRGTRGAKP